MLEHSEEKWKTIKKKTWTMWACDNENGLGFLKLKMTLALCYGGKTFDIGKFTLKYAIYWVYWTFIVSTEQLCSHSENCDGVAVLAIKLPRWFVSGLTV